MTKSKGQTKTLALKCIDGMIVSALHGPATCLHTWDGFSDWQVTTMCSQVVIGLGARRAKDAQCKPAEEIAKQRRCFEPFERGASLLTKTLQVVKSTKLYQAYRWSFKANWKQPWIWRFNICVWSNPPILGTWTLEASRSIVLSRLCGIGRACLCSLSGALRLWVCHSNWQKQFLHIEVQVYMDMQFIALWTDENVWKCTKCIEMPYSMESLSLFAMWQGRSKADLKLLLENSRALTRALHKGGHGVVAVVPRCELPQPHN